MVIEKHGRYWKVVDAEGALVCLTVYKKGAVEVVKRVQALDAAQQWQDTNGPTERCDDAAEAMCPLF
jgi:hypothetical protein